MAVSFQKAISCLISVKTFLGYLKYQIQHLAFAYRKSRRHRHLRLCSGKLFPFAENLFTISSYLLTTFHGDCTIKPRNRG